jgi:pSer/pThr/pTyr-binding forkhead associated (FHA) protein
MACVVLDFEGLDILTHELIGDAVTIGRAPSNDIVIDHPTVSAQHARLTKSPSGYRIKDLESTNGTQINGVSISDAQLKNGAEIRFGYNRNGAWKACFLPARLRAWPRVTKHAANGKQSVVRRPEKRAHRSARKSPKAFHRDLAAS